MKILRCFEILDKVDLPFPTWLQRMMIKHVTCIVLLHGLSNFSSSQNNTGH